MPSNLQKLKLELSRHRVRFVETGPNVAKGNINVKCPFCGQSDPSEHLGINPSNGFWGCWRNSTHRSKNLAVLLSKLFQITIREAQEVAAGIIGKRSSLKDFDDSEWARLKNKFNKNTETEKLGSLQFPVTFKRLDEGYNEKIISYLKDRGFKKKDLSKLSNRYNLKYANTGEWAWRIIFPIYHEGRLVNWTGRTVYQNSGLRYRQLSMEEDEDRNPSNETPLALRLAPDCLLFEKSIMKGGKKLYICEGPFDALKIDYFGWKYGIRATCLFTSGMSEEQKLLVETIHSLGLYEEYYICLDRTAYFNSYRIKRELSAMKPEIYKIPQAFDDPGEFSRKFVEKYL